jgi:hypothetical protein
MVHDLLADEWAPAWAGNFADHAARHGLAYVGAARPAEYRVPPGGSEQAAAWLLEFAGGDPARRDQLVAACTPALEGFARAKRPWKN